MQETNRKLPVLNLYVKRSKENLKRFKAKYLNKKFIDTEVEQDDQSDLKGISFNICRLIFFGVFNIISCFIEESRIINNVQWFISDNKKLWPDRYVVVTDLWREFDKRSKDTVCQYDISEPLITMLNAYDE